MSSLIVTLCLTVGAILLVLNITVIAMMAFVQVRLRVLQAQGRAGAEQAIDVIDRLDRMENQAAGLVSHIDRLAADVIHRELYRDKGSRQRLAIDAAQAGETLDGLVSDYGLSTDEAELLLAMHRDSGKPACMTRTS